MDIEYAFLSDSAQVPPDGKFYVLGGGIDEIKIVQFPSTHPQISLVVKFRLQPIECDRQHKIEIVFWDPDGQPVGPRLNGEFSARRHVEEPTRPGNAQLVMNMLGLQFDRPGDYAFHIVVNGQEMKSLPLYVRSRGQQHLLQ